MVYNGYGIILTSEIFMTDKIISKKKLDDISQRSANYMGVAYT